LKDAVQITSNSIQILPFGDLLARCAQGRVKVQGQDTINQCKLQTVQ
jgi:hypothetical protein